MLFDHDVQRLQLMFQLISHRLADSDLTVKMTDDIREAVRGADFVFSALRVGGDLARALDERLAIQWGALGQETTGPGGFAMALRTVPVLVQYARIIADEAPHAWLLNFTNPAGIITEAITRYSKAKAVGICDSASALTHRIGAFLGRTGSVQATYFGLNHLGWIGEVYLEGQDVMPELLARYEAMAEFHPKFAIFDAALVRSLRLIPNEYLYYYYYAGEARQRIAASEESRGEQVLRLNRALMQQIAEAMARGDANQAWRAYETTMNERQGTYMTAETGRSVRPSDSSPSAQGRAGLGGYESLALDTIRSLRGQAPTMLALNVPNEGSVPGLPRQDVVEVSCVVADGQCRPVTVRTIPEAALGLMQGVKAYERLTVEAAMTGDYDTALQALLVHPLVTSYPQATALLDAFLRAHGEFLPQFQ